MTDPLAAPTPRRTGARRRAAALLVAAGLMLPGAALGHVPRPPPGGIHSHATSAIAGEEHGSGPAMPEHRIDDLGRIADDEARGILPEQAAWALLALASLLLAALIWQGEAARARAAAGRQSIDMPPSTTWTEPVT